MTRIISMSAALAALMTTAPDAGGDISFLAQRDYPVLSPWAVVAGDFNGDQKPDVAVANYLHASVTVMLNGGGVRTAAVHSNPAGLAIADFNNDSRIDLAVANWGFGAVTLLLGKGDGTFGAERSFSAGPQPQSIAVADFNGDGGPDVVVSTSTGAAVLLGTGDGSLLSAVPLGLLETPMGIAVGDFNGDAHIDLAAAFGALGLAVVRGNGDGTFRPATYTSEYDSHGLLAGDFNGDGTLDLASAEGVGGGLVGVRLGNGDGSFQPPASRTNVGFVKPVAAADFNGDSKLDLAITGPAVLLGNGDGTLDDPVTIAAGVDQQSIAVADLNGDANVDVVVTDRYTNYQVYPFGTLSLRLGKGDGTFGQTPGVRTGGETTSLTAADFNSDGAVDFAIRVYHPTPPSGKYVAVALGNGDGTFRRPPAILKISNPVTIAAGDFDGDSRTDIVVTGSAAGGPLGIYLCRGQGDGSLAAPQFLAPAWGDVILATDLTSDDVLDLVVADSRYGVKVLVGNGNGTFRGPINVVAGSVAGVAVEDFNGDRLHDLAVGRSNKVSVMLGRGDGTFQPPTDTGLDAPPLSLSAADLNGDGAMDLAVAEAWPRQQVAVLLGTGSGTFQPTVGYYVTPNPPNVVQAADLNGDRQPDLAVLNGNTLSILVGNGDGTFQLQVMGFSTTGGARQIAFADFTRDGRIDAAVGGDGMDNDIGVALLYNTTP